MGNLTWWDEYNVNQKAAQRIGESRHEVTALNHARGDEDWKLGKGNDTESRRMFHNEFYGTVQSPFQVQEDSLH